MGRPLRTLEAGGYYHVTARGNDGCAILTGRSFSGSWSRHGAADAFASTAGA